MESLNTQVFYGLGDGAQVVRVVVRLSVALLMGAALGYQREETGKAAGLRTHMLVAVGAALFVLAPIEAGVKLEHLMRVVQGLTAGIGFLGAGAILKLSEQRQIKGLTTAACLWVTAAMGTAIGMGLLWPAVCTVGLALIVLSVAGRLEALAGPRDPGAPGGDHSA